mgnify:CR=1 FL=1
MMASAWYQGKSAAVACDALGETGKGMVNYPVSQKATRRKRVVLARGPATRAFF